MKHMEESYRSIQELGLGAESKSNLAASVGSLLSPSSSFPTNQLAVSFRVNQPESSNKNTTTSGDRDEPPQDSSSSSRGHDLGGVVGDRRLQGVRVVRGASGGEKRWVVTCGGHALEEKRHVVRRKIVDAPLGDQAVEGVDDGDDGGSDSDTSSDLFELDLEDANNYRTTWRTGD